MRYKPSKPSKPKNLTQPRKIQILSFNHPVYDLFYYPDSSEYPIALIQKNQESRVIQNLIGPSQSLLINFSKSISGWEQARLRPHGWITAPNLNSYRKYYLPSPFHFRQWDLLKLIAYKYPELPTQDEIDSILS